jgi:hypothetical protein
MHVYSVEMSGDKDKEREKRVRGEEEREDRTGGEGILILCT